MKFLHEHHKRRICSPVGLLIIAATVVVFLIFIPMFTIGMEYYQASSAVISILEKRLEEFQTTVTNWQSAKKEAFKNLNVKGWLSNDSSMNPDILFTATTDPAAIDTYVQSRTGITYDVHRYVAEIDYPTDGDTYNSSGIFVNNQFVATDDGSKLVQTFKFDKSQLLNNDQYRFQLDYQTTLNSTASRMCFHRFQGDWDPVLASCTVKTFGDNLCFSSVATNIRGWGCYYNTIHFQFNSSYYQARHLNFTKPRKLIMEYRSFDDPVSDGSKITYGSSEQRIADIVAKRKQRKVAIVLIAVSSSVLALFIFGGIAYWHKRIRFVENASGKLPKDGKTTEAADAADGDKKSKIEKKEEISKGNQVKATAMLEKDEITESPVPPKKPEEDEEIKDIPVNKKEEVEHKSMLKVTPVVEPEEIKPVSNSKLKITGEEIIAKSNRASKAPSEAKLSSNNDIAPKSSIGLMVEPEVYGKSSRNSRAPSESKLKSTNDVRLSGNVQVVEKNHSFKAPSNNDIRHSNALSNNDVRKSKVILVQSEQDIVNIQISGIESDPNSRSPSNNDITKSRMSFDFEDTKILEVEKKEQFDKSSSSDEN